MDLFLFCFSAEQDLKEARPENWAAIFVSRRIELQRRFLRGKILSTAHGADIFSNILDCLSGAKWEEKGELGENFRKFIKENVASN